jgi:hypothetical protein
MADRKCDMVLATTARWRDTQIDAEAIRWNPARQTFERWDGAAWVLLSPTFDACTISGSPAAGDSSGALASTHWVTEMARGYVTLGTDQTITGAKTFTGAVTVPVPADDDSSAAPATTSYVTEKISAIQTKIAALEEKDSSLEAKIAAFQEQIDDAYAAISAAYIEAGGTLDG